MDIFQSDTRNIPEKKHIRSDGRKFAYTSGEGFSKQISCVFIRYLSMCMVKIPHDSQISVLTLPGTHF